MVQKLYLDCAKGRSGEKLTPDTTHSGYNLVGTSGLAVERHTWDEERDIMFVIVIRSMCGTPSCEAPLTVAVERSSVHGNGHNAVELLYLSM
jgi:hypothetical protein